MELSMGGEGEESQSCCEIMDTLREVLKKE
jgi:hypothetical protein